MGAYWLLSLVQFFEKYKHQFIAAPVQFANNGSFFQTFQSLDFMTMQGITGAIVNNQSGTMCNGANLAYTKKAFNAVGGFKDIDDIASGDDMLLMYKIDQKYPARTGFLKCSEAIVTTAPMHNLKSFLQQRIRWASKASKFKDKRIKLVLGLVYFFNLTFLMLQLFSLQNSKNLITFFGLLILKAAIEFSFLKPVSQFFKKEKELYPFFILQFIHIPYILISGLMGQFGTYRWKERIVK
jgi:cellulose synthase/poly-beta-1,6-N-acetylglucosamine synthase-like glycosyltransferase